MSWEQLWEKYLVLKIVRKESFDIFSTTVKIVRKFCIAFDARFGAGLSTEGTLPSQNHCDSFFSPLSWSADIDHSVVRVSFVCSTRLSNEIRMEGAE